MTFAGEIVNLLCSNPKVFSLLCFPNIATFVLLVFVMDLGISQLWQHDFEHNRSLKALSIMPV